jgi:hypothetical protein
VPAFILFADLHFFHQSQRVDDEVVFYHFVSVIERQCLFVQEFVEGHAVMGRLMEIV